MTPQAFIAKWGKPSGVPGPAYWLNEEQGAQSHFLLTKLYNQRPAWLTMAHERLNAAVAAAYGWEDYIPTMADEEILRRLLALNLERGTTLGLDAAGVCKSGKLPNGSGSHDAAAKMVHE